jgi:hypothetical protein
LSKKILIPTAVPPLIVQIAETRWKHLPEEDRDDTED